MRVTSFKDVETYLYSSVVLPLKSLKAEPLRFPSPITGKDSGDVWELRVGRQAPQRSYRRNYQRTEAENSANYEVRLSTSNNTYVVALYSPRNRWVRVYERPFKTLGAVPLLGKLYEAFSNNTPFTKVISELDPPAPRYSGGGFSDQSPIEPDYDDDENVPL